MPTPFRSLALVMALALGSSAVYAQPPANSEVSAAPRFATSNPRDGSVVSGTLEQISLAFTAEVDLTYLDVEKPDGTKILLFDRFADGAQDRRANSFVDSLPHPLDQPGHYYINYGASFTIGRSTSTLAAYTSFEIAAPPETDEGVPMPAVPNRSGDTTAATRP
ncbi:MAG: copper resistance protein CopC [Sphingopyxis sp.]|uniref:copper resistance protein CopC n=1 Tax=Sphingopyxis sp. TaxID=1908224 RepID=UPI002ABC2435|nr:copper resistance protein CopC [Sphingopyxis sp.]MDZ3832331.1 copper resistance protein CopC [Sphingopyxis sp.]